MEGKENMGTARDQKKDEKIPNQGCTESDGCKKGKRLNNMGWAITWLATYLAWTFFLGAAQAELSDWPNLSYHLGWTILTLGTLAFINLLVQNDHFSLAWTVWFVMVSVMWSFVIVRFCECKWSKKVDQEASFLECMTLFENVRVAGILSICFLIAHPPRSF